MNTLDDARILRLLSTRDSIGYISLYVNIDPSHKDNPPGRIMIKDRLQEIEHEIRENRPREDWVAYTKALEASAPELDGLLDTRTPGIGRALFIAISSGEAEMVSLQLPMVDRVVFDSSPYIRPLVQAWDDGRVGGYMVIGRTAAVIGEWQYGKQREILHLDFDKMVAEYREQGTGQRRPLALPKETAHQTRGNRYKRRGTHHKLFMQILAKRLEEVWSERGWERVIMYGHIKWRRTVLENVHTHNTSLITELDNLIIEENIVEREKRLTHDFANVNRRREGALVNEIISQASGEGKGILGVPQTVAALAEGRVERLVYCSDAHVNLNDYAVNGFVSDNEKSELGIERIIESAIRTGASVTPVEAESASLLDDYDGVGALLRW